MTVAASTRRVHLDLGRHLVQPNGGIAVADLAVDNGAVVEPVQPARGEAEGADQEVVGGFDVLVDEDGDDGGRWGRAHVYNSAPCAVLLYTPCAHLLRAARCWTGPMLETPEEMENLQALLDASMASAGPHLRDIITDERRLTRGGADAAPAGHASAGARHGDRRRAAPRRAGRRLLPARHLLVQHREGLGAPAPPGPAARLQCHPPPGRRARRHGARDERRSPPSRTRQRRPAAGHARRVPAQGGTRSSSKGLEEMDAVGVRIVPEKMFTFSMAQ